MKMKRLVPGLALGIVLVLAACRPADQGSGSSASPTEVVESAAPSTTQSAEPMESESAAPTPDDYEY
jgi:hypothetical protein